MGIKSAFRILSTLLLIAVILICLPLTAPRLLGYEPYAIISGSMEPEIPVGSVVYAKEAPAGQIEEGSVIVFYGGRDQDAVTTHRVMKNDAAQSQFITKGDANEKEDVNPVSYSDLIGEVRLSVPFLGMLQPLVSGWSGRCLLFGALVLALALNLLGREKD